MSPSLYLASSPWFVIVASSFYLSMAMAICIANIPWWLCAVVISIMFLDFMHVIRVHGFRSHQNAVGILFQDCDKWQYQLHSGRCLKGQFVRQRSFCSQILIIMYFQHLSGGRYVIIPRDSLSAHNFRLLAFKFQT